MAVHLLLAEPDSVGTMVIDHLDSLESWAHLLSEGRRLADMWL